MAVVYLHRKESDLSVFYVGIGKNMTRPYKKSNRTDFWKRTVNKHGLIVEIVKDDVTWEEACELEELMIETLGRRDLGTGCLVNMTKGGDGLHGLIHTEEAKRKIGIASKNRKRGKMSKEAKRKMSMAKDSIKKPIIQLDLEGRYISEFESARDAIRLTKVSGVYHALKGRSKTAGGYKWKYKTK